MNILSYGFSFLKSFFFQWAPAHISGLPPLSENAFFPGKEAGQLLKPWEEWRFFPAKRSGLPGDRSATSLGRN